MSSIVGSLRVMLGMDSAAFEKGLNKTQQQMKKFQRQMERTGKNLQRTGRNLSLQVTAPLTALAWKSVDAQKQQEQAIAAVDAALRSMGDGAGFTLGQLEDMASKLQDKSLYGDEAILKKVTANLLTFGNISGDVFERAQQSAIDLSARLGQDLQSSAVMLGKALNDPVKGITALTRVGVSFTEQQKEQIKAMAEAGDVAGAQRLILEELERQYKGQAEALANTDSGRITQAWNAIGDASEKVGAIILPILADIAEKVQAWAEKFQELEPKTQKLIVVAGGLAAALGPVLVALGGIILVVKPLVGIMAALASPFVAVGVAAAAAGYLIYKNWDTIKEAVKRAVTAVGDFISGALEDLRALGARMLEALQQVARDIWHGAKEIGSQIVEGIRQGLEEKWQGLKDRVSSIGTGITDTFKDVLGIKSPSRVFAEAGANIVDGIVVGLSGALPALESVMQRIGGGVLGSSGFEGSLNKIGSALGDVITKTRSWGDVLRGTLSSWQRAMQSSATSSLAGMVPGGKDGFLGGLVSSVFGGLKLFAKGGVVSSATAFPMRGGLGVMGEAGPEAIMPLRRGRDGALGVMANMPPIRLVVEASEDLRITAAQAGQSAAVDVVVQNNRALAERQRRR